MGAGQVASKCLAKDFHFLSLRQLFEGIKDRRNCRNERERDFLKLPFKREQDRR